MRTNYLDYITNHTMRCKASSRGGGIEIGLTELFPYIKEASMTAYQNYLGGGMLGSIGNSYNFSVSELKKRDQAKLKQVTEAVNRYYHSLTNHEGDKWESATYEENQTRPESAY